MNELMTEVLERKHNDNAYWAGVKAAEGMIKIFNGNLRVDNLNRLLDEVCGLMAKTKSSAERDYLAGMMYELEDELKELKRGGR